MPEVWQLAQMQGLPLELKVKKTVLRIREWYEAWDGDVYTSFSGGIDSTVLKDIVDGMGLNIPSVFVDTGLEYPEVRNFAMSQSNVTVLHPSMNFRKVIMEYGYPVVSKEVAQVVREAKIGLERNDGSYAFRIAKLNGTLKDKNGNPSKFNMKKWKFLLDAPFDISEKCCKVMKKDPCKEYEKKTGRKPIIGTMAEESGIRLQRWMRHGCNAFEGDRPASNPLSFWTHKDILLYIVTRKLPYARVYGQIRAEYRGQVIPPPFCAEDHGSLPISGIGAEALQHRCSENRMYVLYVRVSSGKDSEPFSEDAGYSPKSVEVLHEACQRRRSGRAGSPGVSGSTLEEGGNRWTGKLTSVYSATSPGCEKTSAVSTVSEGAARTPMEPVIVFLITRSIVNPCENGVRGKRYEAGKPV